MSVPAHEFDFVPLSGVDWIPAYAGMARLEGNDENHAANPANGYSYRVGS